jgi:cysteine desulfurase/selenocysteine lyase
LFEDARLKVGEFINAPNPEREIVFTKNVTESINLVAQSWGRGNLKPADVVLLSEMEHHANIVPWQIMASQIGFEIRYLKITDDGYLILDDLKRQLDGVKLVGITLMSNVLGTINDISEIVAMAHDAGALVLADGAQFVPHLPTDVAQIGCDFLAFTGHKMLGPTGIGILWAPTDILDKMPPFLGGGEMIADVTLEGFRPTEIPWKFEAGTPPIAEAVGLLEAVKYLKNIGMSKIREHEIEMIEYTFDHLKKRFGDDLSIHGPKDAKHRGGVFSFAYKDVHPHDLAQILDSEGICIRAGHHCAKPLMRRLGVTSTARASVYIYNDFNDIVALGDGLGKVKDIFG